MRHTVISWSPANSGLHRIGPLTSSPLGPRSTSSPDQHAARAFSKGTALLSLLITASILSPAAAAPASATGPALAAREQVRKLVVEPEEDPGMIDVAVFPCDDPDPDPVIGCTGLDGSLNVKLVVSNQRSVVYGLTFSGSSLPGVPDASTVPLMAKRSITFPRVIVQPGTDVRLRADKVSPTGDEWAFGITRGTYGIYLLDLLTVIEVFAFGTYPPPLDHLASWDSESEQIGAGALAALDTGQEELKNSGIDLADSAAKLLKGDPTGFLDAIKGGVDAVQHDPEVFSEYLQRIGWKGQLSNAESLQSGAEQVSHALGTISDLKRLAEYAADGDYRE